MRISVVETSSTNQQRIHGDDDVQKSEPSSLFKVCSPSLLSMKCSAVFLSFLVFLWQLFMLMNQLWQQWMEMHINLPFCCARFLKMWLKFAIRSAGNPTCLVQGNAVNSVRVHWAAGGHDKIQSSFNKISDWSCFCSVISDARSGCVLLTGNVALALTDRWMLLYWLKIKTSNDWVLDVKFWS